MMSKQDDLLLTDEAILLALDIEAKRVGVPERFRYPMDTTDMNYHKALCEAQLAKALPIIEKQERERIIEMLGHCRETRRGYIGSYVVWTHAVEEVWQALKGE